MAHTLNKLSPHAVAKAVKPGRYGDGGGLYLVVDANGSRKWVLRFSQKGKQRDMGLGSPHTFCLAEVRAKARILRQQILTGIDPIEQRRTERLSSPAVRLHERVVRKFHEFEKRGIVPEAYLYRHYQPDGDLLYVGITMSITSRHRKHFKEAAWKDYICFIVVEPFARREDALAAEVEAIRSEFPKYNSKDNRDRHTVLELLPKLGRK